MQLHYPIHLFKAAFNRITNTDGRAQIDRSLQYGRPIRTPLSACPGNLLSQPIMASVKDALFLWLNKARNLTIVFVFTDDIQVCY